MDRKYNLFYFSPFYLESTRSKQHFDKVIGRLAKWKWCDFNQGLDPRLMKDYHAERILAIKNPHCRLALDSQKDKEVWESAFDKLRKAGIAKRHISSYVLIAFDSDPHDAWERCEWIEKHGVKAYPMWYHSLNALILNGVTEQQKQLGWTDEKRKDIMGYYYQHRQGKGKGFIRKYQRTKKVV